MPIFGIVLMCVKTKPKSHVNIVILLQRLFSQLSQFPIQVQVIYEHFHAGDKVRHKKKVREISKLLNFLFSYTALTAQININKYSPFLL